MEWWNDIRMLCARYLVASESMERSGPVAAAVRGIGYQSDDSEGEGSYGEEGDEGSSVEEEEEDEEAMYATDEGAGGPPEYSHPEPGSGVVLGPNGYPVSVFLSPVIESVN